MKTPISRTPAKRTARRIVRNYLRAAAIVSAPEFTKLAPTDRIPFLAAEERYDNQLDAALKTLAGRSAK